MNGTSRMDPQAGWTLLGPAIALFLGLGRAAARVAGGYPARYAHDRQVRQRCVQGAQS
jgi:hypothetical protein